MPGHSEAHRLGPHVVGQRVVVRRLLTGETGPSGGPAMTDVLGTCTEWSDTHCTVQPEHGDPVTIALADIVSGKPVPPRPSVRHRVTPLECQTHGLALFADLVTEPVGDWVLRSSPTATARRANSCLAFVPTDAPDPYDAVVAYYDGLGQRPIAAVLPESAEDAFFRDRGWVLESHDADTLFQLASVAQVVRRLDAPADGVGAATITIEDGLAVVRIGDGSGRWASGVAAYDRDWVGFRSIEVAPEHRRRGLGLAVMAALLEWGAERGARTAYLQVLADNDPALALYDRLGFTTHHAYRYLAAPNTRSI